MQLFITDFEKEGDIIRIVEDRVLKQMRTVLRMREGSTFFVQLPKSFWEVIRYTVTLVCIDRNSAEASVVSHELCEHKTKQMAICLAMPNKVAKIELVCQKLTEIGIGSIYLWKAERSQMSDISDNKMKRIESIILEAAEQSFSFYLPHIQYIQTPFDVSSSYSLFLSDMWGQTHMSVSLPSTHWALVIGPEGWLTEKDYSFWGVDKKSSVSLGWSVLRMETAAIVGGWWLCNS